MIKPRRMRWLGHVTRMGEKRNAYRVLVGKTEVKKPHEDTDVDGRIILKWMLDISDGSIDRIHLAYDRDQWRALVDIVLKFRVPQNVSNFSE
jgi:hypothetical protein